MKYIILLATAAIALPFIISSRASVSTAGRAVADRFLERSFLQTPTIPSDPKGEPAVNADNLRAWVTSPETAGHARAYAWRVMPLDFLYLVALGTFLALAATTLASTIAWPPALAKLPGWTGWIWLIFPLAYMLADLVEDCLIVILMTRPASISPGTVDLLSVLRNVKIGANILAITQIFALGLAGCVWK